MDNNQTTVIAFTRHVDAATGEASGRRALVAQKPRADVKQTAAAIRTALRAEFPGCAFSVRMDRGTSYGWISVSWTDGPSDMRVRRVVEGFESSRFDGMDDSYHSTGVTEWTCRGVNTSRRISREALDRALGMIERTGAGERFIRIEGEHRVWEPYPSCDDEQVAYMYCIKVSQ